jgi:hypothetical protein
MKAMRASAAATWLARKLGLSPASSSAACLQILEHGYGHAASSRAQVPIDGDGNPTPWYTYPAIAYLSQLDFSERIVFEYGSGNSTLWRGARSKRVVSVESAPVGAEGGAASRRAPR